MEPSRIPLQRPTKPNIMHLETSVGGPAGVGVKLTLKEIGDVEEFFCVEVGGLIWRLRVVLTIAGIV